MNAHRTLRTAARWLTAALTLAAFGLSAHRAQAQFVIASPTGTTLHVHPDDTVSFSGTITNLQSEQLDSVTIGLQETKPGIAVFFSSFFADLAPGQTENFTGTLKIFDTAPPSTSFFALDANGIGDATGNNYDEFSDNYTVIVTPATVPEASTLVSLSLLLAGLGLIALTGRRRTTV